MRVNTNIQALQAFTALNKTNNDLGVRQMRLATGSRLNRAEDDSAGYTISKKLEAKVRGQAQAMSNIGDAKSMLTVGEGSLGSVMDILQTMKEKTVQAANDSLGAEERVAINNQLNALQKEVTSILEDTTFNGKQLFSDATAGTSFSFQVNAENGETFTTKVGRMSGKALGTETAAFASTVYGDTDTQSAFAVSGTFSGTADASHTVKITSVAGNQVKYQLDGAAEVTIADITAANAGNIVVGEGLTLNIGSVASGVHAGASIMVATDKLGLSVNTNTNAGTALATIDAAINKVSSALSGIGDNQQALSFKEQNLETSKTNYEAARSRIADADFAKEQMQIVKLQVLQQTGIASLAQANANPQSVLSLLR